MSDDCIESRRTESESGGKQNSREQATENYSSGNGSLNSGKLPTSLLKQAMASAKIQQTFREFRVRADLPFEENAPSIEVLLERELVEAYDGILEEIASENGSKPDPLDEDVQEVETACQEFIEEALAEHLESRLEEMESGKSTSDGIVYPDSLINRLKVPRDKDLPDTKGTSGTSDQNQQEQERKRGIVKFGQAALIATIIAGPALAGAAFVNSQSPEKFDSIVGLTMEKTYQAANYLLSGTEEAQATSEVAIKAPSPVEPAVANETVAKAPTDDSETVAVASLNTGTGVLTDVKPIATIPLQPSAQPDAPIVELDEQSVMESGLKALQGDVARLEKLISNPDQQKREELEALILDRRAKISQLEDRMRALSTDPAVPQPASKPETSPGPNIQMASTDPKPVIATSRELNVADVKPAIVAPAPVDVNTINQKFLAAISIRQLSTAQQTELAGKLASGECLVPAAQSVLTNVPTLVMRDLIRAFPDHC